MATQQSASIYITNTTDGNAFVVLFHNNSSNGTQRAEWQVGPGGTVGPMTVYFETGFGSFGILDYWSVLLHVKDGSAPGFYVNSGTTTDPWWKECQLESEDAGQTITLSVSNSTFNVALKSGGCSNGMTKLAPGAPITHVFVVMLENHSFDNVFAMSGIEGITAASPANYNIYNNERYYVQMSAPVTLTTDPGHEFVDVLQQLTGQTSFTSGGPYPAITNAGFALNYATSTTEAPHQPPAPGRVDDVMSCFNTANQLRVIASLATNFAICDHWYSSLPGPTWPNRFFLHGASSSGFDDSPTTAQMAGWELPGMGFKYPNGSLFQKLSAAQIPYRFYNDVQTSPPYLSLFSDDQANGSVLGAVAQVSALSGVTQIDINSLQNFANDLQGPYPYPYTFIEPNYGNITSGTYAGGSSQHPMDDVYGGEQLLASVYGAIANSPYWSSSLLIITYDEHGGFYDSVAPVPAVAPGDNPTYGYNTHGFTFTTLGVRVPAVLVSPLVASGTVDHTQYDHSSVAALLEQLWGLSPMTQRDANANSPLHLLSLGAPRAPATLPVPRPSLRAPRPELSVAEKALIAAQPVPQSGNLAGALAILRKTEAELSAGTPAELAAIQARHAAVRTRGDAEAYGMMVMEKVRLARATRRTRP